MSVKSSSGVVIVAVLALVPVAIWASMGPLGARFATQAAALRSFGQVSALAGTSLFAMTFILNARLRFLEGFFGGMDKVFKAHHAAGAIAFVLLLAHPLLLAANYVTVSLAAAARFLMPGTDLLVTPGIIGLMLMFAFLAFTFYGKWKYPLWRRTHVLLGLAFIFAAYHVLIISSDVSASLPLRAYMDGMVFLGIAGYSYRTILGRYLVRRMEYTVSDVRELGEGIVQITLNPLNGHMRFVPGQFLFVSFGDEAVGTEVHPFTISSSPDEGDLRLSIKAVGDYTSRLKILKRHTPARVEGPFGRFSYRLHPSEGYIWIAGGIGITPFLSMARQLKKGGPGIDLYYSVKKKEEAVFLKEMMEISRRCPNLKVLPHYSDTGGFLNAEIIRSGSGLEGREIFICGPPPMMLALRKRLMGLGVPKGKIHFEEFNLQ